MSDDALAELDDLRIEDLDAVTTETAFQQATGMLMLDKITTRDWVWHAVEATNDALDLPILDEAQERDLFYQAFQSVGHLLKGLTVNAPVDEDFRNVTLALLNGEADVGKWLDVAAEVIDEIVDIPYVPARIEGVVFDRGFGLIAKALHGLLTNGSASDE